MGRHSSGLWVGSRLAPKEVVVDRMAQRTGQQCLASHGEQSSVTPHLDSAPMLLSMQAHTLVCPCTAMLTCPIPGDGPRIKHLPADCIGVPTHVLLSATRELTCPFPGDGPYIKHLPADCIGIPTGVLLSATRELTCPSPGDTPRGSWVASSGLQSARRAC